MLKIKLLIITLSSLLFSCSVEDKGKFDKKNVVGEISDPFGMATYQVFLYDDSTFYLPSEGTIVHWGEGIFSINEDTISFVTTRGEAALFNRYTISVDTTIYSTNPIYILTPIDKTKGLIFLQWYDKR